MANGRGTGLQGRVTTFSEGGSQACKIGELREVNLFLGALLLSEK